LAAEASYVFDACGVIALLQGELGAEVAASLLEATENRCLVHALNLCEVYYDLLRRGRDQDATALPESLEGSGFEIDASLDRDLWQAAGRLKARLARVSLADCFALALTQRLQGTLVTTDHHELDRVADAGTCPILFLR
jgi:uncharacterized protein with PIN domain